MLKSLIATAAFALFSSLLLVPDASASGSINVKNCTEEKQTVCVYNGGDKVRSAAKHRRTLIPGKEWKVRCKGNGLKRCKIHIVKEAGNACPVDKPNVTRIPFKHWAHIVLDGSKRKVVKQRSSSCPR